MEKTELSLVFMWGREKRRIPRGTIESHNSSSQ